MSGKFKVYKSSAGSGKTFRLTLEYLKLALAAPNEFGRILAITFTIKASQEMKSRILEAASAIAKSNDFPLQGQNKAIFEQLVKETEFNEGELRHRAKLLEKEILHNYSDFAVSTIDSFSHRLVRSFAFELNLPVNFKVELDQDLIAEMVVDRFMDEIGRDKKLTSFLQKVFLQHLENKENTNLRSKIEETADLMVKPESLKAVQALSNKKFSDLVKVRQNVWAEIGKLKQQIQEVAANAIELYKAKGLQANDFSHSDLPKFFTRIFDENYAEPSDRLQKQLNGDTTFYKSSAPTETKQKIDSISTMLSETGLLIAELIPRLRLLQHVAPHLDLLALINSLKKHHKDFQREEELFSISDFDTIINNEVKDQPIPFIYEKVGTWYKHILIDEFQDTSITQWENLLPLIIEMVDKQQKTLLVGDAKQAIYRWRGGETTLLSDLPKVKGKEAHQIQSLVREFNEHKLGENWRSRANLIDFNNEFFERLVQNPEFSDEAIYTDLAQNKTGQTRPGGYITIELFASDDQENEGAPDHKEKRLIKLVEQVKNLEDQGFNLNQIAVLNRTNTNNMLCSRALINAGIDIVSRESLLLKNHPLVCLYPAIIAWFIQPENQIVQAQITQQLYNVKAVKGNLHEMLVSMQSKRFGSHSAFAHWLQEYGLSFSLLDLTGLPYYSLWEKLLTHFPNNQSSAFISFFGNGLWNIIATNGNDAAFILDWWEEKKDKLYLDSAQMENGVKVMTIHKSKGLEFEGVIIPFADWSFSTFTDREWVTADMEDIDKVEQINIPITRSGLEGTALDDVYQTNRRNTLLDNYNLLYVATTRAKSELHIFADEKSASNKVNSLIDLFLGESRAYSKGEPVILKDDEAKKKIPRTRKTDYPRADNVLESIKIKNRSARIWNEEKRDSISYGNAVHSILSFIKTEDDVPSALARAYSRGWIKSDEAAEIENQIKELIHHEKLAKYFTESANLLSEQKILLPSGKLYIPDRMLLNRGSKAANLLDFKTGSEKNAHETQLTNYVITLADMGYKVNEALLVYMDPLKLKEVTT